MYFQALLRSYGWGVERDQASQIKNTAGMVGLSLPQVKDPIKRVAPKRI